MQKLVSLIPALDFQKSQFDLILFLTPPPFWEFSDVYPKLNDAMIGTFIEVHVDWLLLKKYCGISLVLAILHLTILTKVLLNRIFWPHEYTLFFFYKTLFYKKVSLIFT